MEYKKKLLSKNQKITILTVAFIALFSVYAVHLFSLQIIEGSVYVRQSEMISQRTKNIPAQRGEIYDRNADTPLVVNTESFAIDITPGEIPKGHYDTVVSRVADFLNVSKLNIDTKVPNNMRNSFNAIEIASNVSFKILTDIAENIGDLPGISWRTKPIRSYLAINSFAHVLGYVGNITREELRIMYNQGYSNISIVGKTGIEREYDALLQGVSGSESRRVDANGRLMAEEPIIQTPEMGKNLILTIDSKIQTLAERALGERVGSAIVLKPASGEILAMVSYPYYDQNIFNEGNTSDTYLEVVSREHNPLLNRSINAVYPPASTFKALMATAILSESTFDPEQEVECKGFVKYGDRIFRCHVGTPGHGWVNLKEALAESCNIYFGTVGRDYIGAEVIASYAKEFGFGEEFSIDLPGQSTGFVPTPSWKERRYHERWLGGDTMNYTIGQGFMLTTPLQVANMMAMIANKGKIYKPHLLKEVRDPVTDSVITAVEPEVLFESSIAPEVWDTVQEYLRYTVTDGSVQFPLKSNKVVQVAGKTGTGEVNQYKDSWHSWFASFGSYDAPPEDQIVVLVLVEAVNDWEWWAPYATSIIYQGVFANQTYDEALDALGFRYLDRPVGRQE